MTHALALPVPSAVGNLDAYIPAANRYPLLSETDETRLAERSEERRVGKECRSRRAVA